ncbi:MAG: MFS transporter, partial [Acidobacteria bacterium]|nr:MFS transporter [Acidobacteriota bacterium]
VFYCIGAASLTLTLFWLTLYPEKKIARQTRAGGTGAKGKERVPLLSLLRHRSAWGIALGQMGYLYGYNFFVNWLPGYLILERKMSVLKTGLVASLPFWMGMVGTLGGGWLADTLMRRGLGPTGSRKGVIGVGMTLATITVVIAAFTPQTWLAVTLLTLCMGSLRATTGAANSIPIDLAPHNAVGSLTSIQNFGGNIGGLLAPVVTGTILQASGSFVWALVAAGAMSLFGAVCYVFMVGRVEPLQISS